jgi:DNA processing protein
LLDSAWVALSLTEHIGGKKLRALMQYFDNDPHAVLNADIPTLKRVPGIGPKIAQSIRTIVLTELEAAIPLWQEQGIVLCTLHHASYPVRLCALEDPPPTLFIRGRWDEGLVQRAVAVVGTRHPSPESVKIAQNAGFELAQRGYTVVSGLALGIDAAAHMGALALPEGQTIAVLGSGVLNIYPPQNRPLAQAVRGRGAVISELHPQAQPNPANLVARNRIISGLSLAVVVIETSDEGGAMYAARRAREQGRAVYAIDNSASGNRALIESGAVAIAPDLSDFPL